MTSWISSPSFSSFLFAAVCILCHMTHEKSSARIWSHSLLKHYPLYPPFTYLWWLICLMAAQTPISCHCLFLSFSSFYLFFQEKHVLLIVHICYLSLFVIPAYVFHCIHGRRFANRQMVKPWLENKSGLSAAAVYHFVYTFLFTTLNRFQRYTGGRRCGFPGEPADGRLLNHTLFPDAAAAATTSSQSHASQTSSSSKMSSGYNEDDYVVFACNEGYSMNGHDRRRCQANGTWSGQLPICGECSVPSKILIPTSGYCHYLSSSLQQILFLVSPTSKSHASEVILPDSSCPVSLSLLSLSNSLLDPVTCITSGFTDLLDRYIINQIAWKRVTVEEDCICGCCYGEKVQVRSRWLKRRDYFLALHAGSCIHGYCFEELTEGYHSHELDEIQIFPHRFPSVDTKSRSVYQTIYLVFDVL